MAKYTFEPKKAEKTLPVAPSKKKISFKNLFYRGYMLITVALLAYIAYKVT